MAYLFPLPAKAGKTVAATLFTFVPKNSLDVVRACAYFGGSFSSMMPKEIEFKRRGCQLKKTQICHNYTPLLSNPDYWPAPSLNASSQKGYKGLNTPLAPELTRQLRNGQWYQYKDGYYENSSLSGIRITDSMVNQIGKNTPSNLAFDSDGRGMEFFVDELNDPVLFDDLFANERNLVFPATYMVLYNKLTDAKGNIVRNVTNIFVRADVLASNRGVNFDGIPYIKVTETAVNEPRGVINPKIDREREHSITSEFRKAFNNAIHNILYNGAKNINPGAAAGCMQAGYALPEGIALNDFIKSEPLEQYMINVSNPDRSEDRYIYGYMKDGTIRTAFGLALLKLFGSSRCFVDAVTTLALTAGGSAISGGVAGAFLAALQNSTESEAILLYALSVDDEGHVKDPMSSYNPEGLVNGAVSSTSEGDNDEETYLSDKSIAVYSRNAPSREVRYYLVNQKRSRVYAKDYTYDFEKGTVTETPGVAYSEETMCKDGNMSDAKFVAKRSKLNKHTPITIDSVLGISR